MRAGLSSEEVLLALQLLGGTIRVLGFRDFTTALYDNDLRVGVVRTAGDSDVTDDVTRLVEEGTPGTETDTTESEDEETAVDVDVADTLPVGGACGTASCVVEGGASETVVGAVSAVRGAFDSLPEAGVVVGASGSTFIAIVTFSSVGFVSVAVVLPAILDTAAPGEFS